MLEQPPDLVQDSKLESKVAKNITVHVIYEPEDPPGQRPTRTLQYWRREKRIGAGGYGQVWLERCIKGGISNGPHVRVVKELALEKSVTASTAYRRELEAIAKFSHQKYQRCFVKSFGWFETSEALLIAMEYLELGDLYQHMLTRGPLPELEVQHITYQILEALDFMHENRFAHRDLKPKNILIMSRPPDAWWVKLADFGLSKRLEEQSGPSTLKGTPGFLAPEFHGFINKSESRPGIRDDRKGDVWALGETIFLLLTKRPTFQNVSRLAEYVRTAVLFPYGVLGEQGVSKLGQSFIGALMRPVPEDRPVVSKALANEWLKPVIPQSLDIVNFEGLEHLDLDDVPECSDDELDMEPSARWTTETIPPVTESTDDAEPPVPLPPLLPNPSGINSRPDIVVAIDVDSMFTTVAWVTSQFGRGQMLRRPIQIIQDWPGCSTRDDPAVPTCLVFDKDDSLSSWGFLCEEDSGPGKQRKEFFADILADAHSQFITGAPHSVQLAQGYMEKYLGEIYDHVKRTIQRQTGIGPDPGWKTIAVEFIFSICDDWLNRIHLHVAGANFLAAISSAGFGSEGVRHSVSLSTLTKSQALATSNLASINPRQGYIFLVVRGGTSTASFALLRVLDSAGLFPTLAQISQGEGLGIGSAVMDRDFIALLTERFRGLPELLRKLPPNCIQRLAGSERWKEVKRGFGKAAYRQDDYRLPIEGVGVAFSNHTAGIEDGQFVISLEELRSLFASHIDRILREIQKWRSLSESLRDGGLVRGIILSGELYDSAYARIVLWKPLQGLHILQTTDPALSVIKGLICHRLQQLDLEK